MTSDVALGIDVGTTSVKVLLLDQNGGVLQSASSPHSIAEAEGRVEVDAEDWWHSFCTALAQLDTDAHRIVSIGFSGNMSSIVLVDDALVPLRPAILLADSRGAAQLFELGDELTTRIVTATGNIPETVFSLASLLWLRDHEPEVLSQAATMLTAKDFLRARLSGVAATEITDAANTLLVRGGDWDDELIVELGLPRSIFPCVLPSDGDGGKVSSAAAAVTGLPAGVPLALGTGDVQAALLGSGGLPAGTVAVSLGTSATVMAPLPEADFSPAALGKLTMHPDSDGGCFALGSLLTGGLALNWLRSTMGHEMFSGASSEPLSSPLFFLPYLAGSGSPDFVSQMRGTIFGLTPATRPADLLSASMEAIAFDLADLIEVLAGDYRSLVLSGGGCRIDAWPQILADVLGISVTCFDSPDLSAIGAAMIAWRRIGVEVRLGGERRVVQQRPQLNACWQARRNSYRQARLAALEYYVTTTQSEDRMHHS